MSLTRTYVTVRVLQRKRNKKQFEDPKEFSRTSLSRRTEKHASTAVFSNGILTGQATYCYLKHTLNLQNSFSLREKKKKTKNLLGIHTAKKPLPHIHHPDFRKSFMADCSIWWLLANSDYVMYAFFYLKDERNGFYPNETLLIPTKSYLHIFKSFKLCKNIYTHPTPSCQFLLVRHIAPTFSQRVSLSGQEN